MSFFSTRGGACVTASQAVLWGLAADGGLYVPSMFASISPDRIARLCEMPYPQRAARVLRHFLEDYSIAELEECVGKAYDTANWDDPAVAPLKPLDDNLHVLELFHGPTLAFKDIALRLLPHLIALAARKIDEHREISILVATSGDTGKAALEGFRDVPGTSCSVFYPARGVSDIQRLQMATTAGRNTHVIGVNGNFDDTQTGVKALFASPDFHERMNALGKLPSSANSINFGRLAPQVAYYFSAYADLIRQGAIRMGQNINFVVPTGNFGNILAGFYAKRMGLPIGRLVCASNRNNVLSDFFTDGIYYTHRTFFQTISPSMDILISSNLERLLYESTDRDPELVKTWMNQLRECGSFSIGAQRLRWMQETFYADFADDSMTLSEIKRVYERTGYLMDPHTAVGSFVLGRYREATGDRAPTVLVATASPYKFAPDVLAALDGPTAARGEDAFACIDALERRTGLAVPEPIRALRALPVRHDTTCDREAMGDTLLRELAKA